jgi:hypothetical protein
MRLSGFFFAQLMPIISVYAPHPSTTAHSSRIAQPLLPTVLHLLKPNPTAHLSADDFRKTLSHCGRDADLAI